MTVATPRLEKKQVRSIKKAIVAGAPMADLAASYEVAYMTIYKIATGVTWKTVKPRGRLIGVRDYSERRVMSLAKCEMIALKKIQKRLSNVRIAGKIKASESTIRRAVVDGRAALAVRLDLASMNGTLRKFRKRTGISDDEAHRLGKITVPDWIRREIESDGE